MNLLFGFSWFWSSFLLFWWGCPSFHFIIYNTDLNSSPTLMYSNLFLFTTASFHFFSHNINVTFSPTLTFSNLFHVTTASFHFLIYNLTLIFLLYLRITTSSSSILVASLHCGILALKYELEVLLVAQLVWVVLFTKQDFFGEGLYVTFFILFLVSCSGQVFNFCCTLLPRLIFHYCIYQKKNFM